MPAEHQNTQNRSKIAALYHFADFPDFKTLQAPIKEFCQRENIRGTLLLAAEGINGTIAGPAEGIDRLIDYFRTGNIFKGRLKELGVKYSYADEMPFLRLKVRLKNEIVTLRAPEANPAKQVGTYVKPQEWNEIISDPDLIVIDTRNDYEVALGTFKDAVDPQTQNFTQFKDYVAENLDPAKQKKVAMFCTGGIRCEKASAYMLAQGFEEVYHLKGGILQYLEDVPQEESLWQGDCFVFDDRVAVGHDLKPSAHTLCRACRYPLSVADQQSPDFIAGIQCPHCVDKLTPTERQRAEARQKQMELAKQRGIAHLGDTAATDAKREKQKKQELRAKTYQHNEEDASR